ncbi:ceramide glucosyltransferase [Rhodobacter xanthinilyticus]|uniref:Ceramide glucosyltransferase n=1 Tax=Rhodobacter xanthinilyticus TaxID=1850250 RepID=A0A1D9MBV5_9RHOB|nr:glycosyltransferase [Rhodobacter xanthinilyticus]AOZ69219.1 ceramide glucosyltransferase [Rhodobacter xanthinilyticus]
MIYLLWALFALPLGLHLLSAGLSAARYLPRRPAPAPAPEALPFISLIRPVCGLDPFDAETLGSSFGLDYPDYEVIFCVADPADPVVPLVRALIAAHPGQRAQLLIGETPISANPKLNNLQKAIPAARGAYLAMTDSNLLLPRDYLRALMAAWGPATGLVSGPPVGVRAENFWGAVECAFLNGNQARWQLAADAVGLGFAQGKTLFWRRDILAAGGGLAGLGRNMAEDVAATKMVREQGLRVRLPRQLFAQPIGARAARAVWDRQLRWSKVRRDGFVGLFAAEILQGPWLAAAALIGLVAAGAAPGAALVALPVAWYGAELGLARLAGWPAGPRDLAAAVVRDLWLPALWAVTWRTRDFTWRGTAMTHAGALAEAPRG